MNSQSCSVLWAEVLLLLAVFLLGWFGIDVWNHSHNAQAASTPLNYGHLQSALIAAAGGVLCLVAAFLFGGRRL
jgi:TRAP-type C4-dicarboxylate transport system permease small subunit